MTPDAIHFMATLIRHERGVLAAEEKFLRSPTYSVEQALQVIAYRRKILDAYERSFGTLVVDK